MRPTSGDVWDVRSAAAASLVATGVCVAFLLIYLARGVLILLFVAIVLATALRPLIAWIERRGLSHNVSVVTAYALAAVLVGSVLLAVTPSAVEQLRGLSAAIPKTYAELREYALRSPNRAVHTLGANLPLNLSLPQRSAANAAESGDKAAEPIRYAKLLVRSLLAIWATLLLAFYWSLQEDRVIQWVLLALPAARREAAKDFMLTLLSRIGAFLRGQGILCLVVGAMACVTFLLLGLPYAVVLGVIAGLCEAVPFFGPVLGFTPAVFVAASVGWSRTISVVVAAIVIQQIENYLLAPRIMDKSVGVPPMVTLLAFAAFGTLFGVVGIIFAIPLAAIIQVTAERFVFSREALNPPPPDGRDRLSVLHYEAGQLVRDIRLQFREQDGSTGDEADRFAESMESIAHDLARMVENETASPASNGPLERDSREKKLP